MTTAEDMARGVRQGRRAALEYLETCLLIRIEQIRRELAAIEDERARIREAANGPH